MDTITEYLDQPITVKQVVQSPLFWVTGVCIILAYKLFKKNEPQVNQREQIQQGGTGNSQSHTETHKIASDNQYNDGWTNDANIIGAQFQTSGNANVKLGNVTTTTYS